MIAKYWKKIGFIILLVACLFNIVTKLVVKTSVKDELQQSVQYVEKMKDNKNK